MCLILAMTVPPYSPRLGHRVDERRCPVFLHDLQASLQRTADLFRLEDGTLAVNAEALRQGGEVGGGSLQADSDANVVQGALPHLGDRELMSDVLIVGPVVEHDHQHGNVVVRGGPERPRGVQEVTVVLDADADLARSPERQRNPHRHAHPGPRSTAAGNVSRPVLHLPEPSLPAAQRAVHQDPVVAAYRLPDLGSQPGGRYGLLRPPAFLQVLLDASGDCRMDLPSPRGPLGDPPLQIAVHCALAQTSERPQNLRRAPENGDIRGHEPAVATGPAPDPILLQADTNDLSPLPDDALMAPTVPGGHPRQARRNDTGFRLWPCQRSFDVLDANGQDQVRFRQHLDAGSADVQRVKIREIEGGALLDHWNPEKLTQRLQRFRSARRPSQSLDQQNRPARLPK